MVRSVHIESDIHSEIRLMAFNQKCSIREMTNQLLKTALKGRL
jgi:AmiR/NasT family two-component response regulator